MNKHAKKIAIAATKILLSVAVVLLLWWMFSAIAKNPLVLPTPWEVVRLTFVLLGEGSTYVALLLTLARAAVAFVASLAFALALALLSGMFAKTKPFVDGAVTFFRALPTVAVILLAMIAFQSSTVPVLVAFLVAFPVVYSAFNREITSDGLFVQLCKVYDITPSKKVKYILLPQIRQCFLPQCADTLPLCVKIVIGGEILSLPRLGLGRELYIAKVNLLTAEVIALTLLSLVVCFALSGIFAYCQRRKV